MTAPSLVKAGILTVIIVSTSVISWELYNRNRGFENTYLDDPALWVYHRDMIYEQEKATVFIGSSRINSTWIFLPGSN